MERQARVMQQHSWSRVPHDGFDFLLHVGAVAVDDAFAAGAFLILKRAFVQPQKSVLLKFPAFGAQFAVGAMVAFAVDACHVGDGFLFPFHSFVFWVWRLRQHR